MLLEGKRIIVTAGVTGIGRSTVLKLVELGAKVVAMSRKAPTHESVLKVIEEADAINPGMAKFITCDVSKLENVESAFAEAVEWMGGLDALVNSAGLDGTQRVFEITEEEIELLTKVHLNGTIWTNQTAYKYLCDNGGSIVNIGSGAGIIGIPHAPVYSMLKAGIACWTRCVAQVWGGDLIRVNTLCPAVATDMYYQALAQYTTPEERAVFDAMTIDTIPLGRQMGDPVDAANVIAFLCSDMSSFMTGQLVAVDGGQMMSR